MRKIIGTFMVSALCVLGGSAIAANRTYNETFDIDARGLVFLKSDHGDVEVKTNDGNTVEVRIEVSGSESFVKDFEVSMIATDQGVEITGKTDRWLKRRWIDSNQVRIYIDAPAYARLELRTSGGDMRADGPRAVTMMQTSGGDIDVRNMAGEMEFDTSGGNISAQGMAGRQIYHTSGGNILARDLEGEVTASTSGGNVELEGRMGPVEAKSSGGSLRIELRGENQGIHARTSGGDIHLIAPADMEADLFARTSGGRVKSDLEITVSGRISESKVEGTVNGGGPKVRLTTSGGSIRIDRASR